MNYESALSDRAKIAEPNLMREIDKYAIGNPNFVSLADGNPAFETFPLADLRKYSDDAYANHAEEILLYGPNGGDPKLCDQIAKRLQEKKDVDAGKNQVLVTGGSQGVLFLMPMAFVNPGEKVVFEEFSYSNALTSVRLFGGVPVGVPVDDDGMNMDALEETLRTTDGIKYIYLVPNFSNPLGQTLSKEKRQRLVSLANQYDVLILEDDPYGALRYEGEAEPTIKSMDTEGRVVYSSTFSKTLAAGLRVGYCSCAPEIIDRFHACKSAIDSGTNMAAQIAVSEYLEKNDLDAHIEEARAIYAKKWKAMGDAIKKYINPAVKSTQPKGGMFYWITMPDYVDEKAMFDDLLKKEVGIVPSYVFAADRARPGKAFRMCFSCSTPERIEEGVKRVGEVTDKYCK